MPSYELSDLFVEPLNRVQADTVIKVNILTENILHPTNWIYSEMQFF